MRVIIKTAGGHQHPVPKGMLELMVRLLEEAGLDEKGTYTVFHGRAIRGTAHRGREQIRIIGLNGRGGIRLRVQPGDNSTGREMVIPIPQGLDAKDLEEQLRNALPLREPSKTKQHAAPPPAQQEREEEPPMPTEDRLTKKKPSLSGFAQNQDNVGLLCLVLHEVAGTEWHPAGNLVEILQDRFGWEDHRPAAIGKVLSGIANFKDPPIGKRGGRPGKYEYRLTSAGLELIGEKSKTPPLEEREEAPPTPTGTISELAMLVEEKKRELDEHDARRAKIVEELLAARRKLETELSALLPAEALDKK